MLSRNWRLLLPPLAALTLGASNGRATRAIAATDFVRVRNGEFVIGDRPYHFSGVNFWFAMHLGAARGGDRARLIRELDRLQQLGITNLRVMASSEGPATEPFRVTPALQERPGQLDENLLTGLDFLLAEMGKRNMRAVLVLNNFFQWTGGMAQYVSWATGTPIPYPETNGHSWDDFQNYSARFYASDSAQALFNGFVRTIVARRNTITDLSYRDDPTIMSWQLSNEPRGFEHVDDYVKWADRAGAYLHSIAPKQLVSLGGEGKLAQDLVNTRFEQVSASPALDYLTVHLWIENWGWYDPKKPEETFDRSVGRAAGYLADHVAIAKRLGKPMVLEEFGVSRDGGAFAPGTPVTYRDRFLSMILESVNHLVAEGEPVGGANVWSWSGESTPASPGNVWRPGEPFTGDPAHEKQGWYSIYGSDTSTIAILGRYAKMIGDAGVRPWAISTRVAPDIRVNQVGFVPTAPKLGIVLNSSSDRFAVVNADKGDTVFRGNLAAPQTWPASGETVRIADFSKLQQPGRYVIATADDTKSPAFVIDSAALEPLARASVKAYYFWRASTPILPKYAGPWARAAGHEDRRVIVHPSAASAGRPAGTIFPSPGGWYDAGDYNKYIVNSGITTYTLLSLVEQFPTYVARMTTGIPETDNAAPDILDEALWNLRWMRTMQDPTDGGVYHKLTTPAFDNFEPPSADRAPRYVVQKSTAAALDFAAVMAHASVVLRPYSRNFPGLSDSLTRSAMYAWRWARAHPDSMYDQQRINRLYSPQISTGDYGDRSVADEFQWAGSELFLATKADSFLTVAAPLARTPIAAPAWNYVAPLGVYSLVEHRRDLPRGFDTTALVRRLLDAADTLAARARNSAYRVPIGSVWDWVWGSNAVAANQGMLLVEAYRATNRVEYLDAANAALDYLVGRNAMSQSFVTAFGARMPKFPHHRPSATDGIAPPVPGMLVGGPNPGQEDKCPNYPSKLPARSYVDDVCSYASNEVAINWNAPFAFLAGALDAYRARTGVVQAGERR